MENNDFLLDKKVFDTGVGHLPFFKIIIPGKPYAVSGIENTGNVVPAVSQTVSYTSFERPSQINEGDNTVSFIYNSDYQRVESNFTIDGDTKTVYSFAGGKYQKTIQGQTTKELLYIGGSPYTAPVVIEKQGSTVKTYYLHRDYLGSLTGVSNESGTLEAEYSYTVWGRLRNPADWQTYAIGKEPTLLFGRGYTGHEHLREFGLINMNARLYDPALGRFLSPDPYVQMPNFTQSFNRYSYCLNNPLIYGDPSGALSFNPSDWWKNLFGGDQSPSWDNFSKRMGFDNTQDMLRFMYMSQAIMTIGTISGLYVGHLAAAALFPGTPGFGYGFTYGLTSGFTRGLISGSAGSWISGSDDFLGGLENGALTGLREGLTDAVTYSTYYAGSDIKFLQFVLNNNISDNLDVFEGDKLQLHFTIFGYDFDKNRGGLYWVGSRSLSDGERADMGLELVWGLSLIPDGKKFSSLPGRRKNPRQKYNYGCKLGGFKYWSSNGEKYLFNYKWHDELTSIREQLYAAWLTYRKKL